MKTFEDLFHYWTYSMLQGEKPGTHLQEILHNTCVVTCMDFRTGALFSGAYRIQNAGPRWKDTERSVKAFLQLKKGEQIRLAWLTHGGGCGASKLESGSADPAEIERFTARKRQSEVAKVLTDFEISDAIRHGYLEFIVGHIGMDGHHWTGINTLVYETNDLLSRAGLPVLTPVERVQPLPSAVEVTPYSIAVNAPPSTSERPSEQTPSQTASVLVPKSGQGRRTE